MRHLICILALAALSPLMKGDTIFQASLNGANETIPNGSGATGSITVDLLDDLITLQVAETFSGLSIAASSAHIHCCAAPGSNAIVVLPFSGFPASTSGTYSHIFNLTADLTGITAANFIAGLESGNAYANIHDANFPGGEIRGQLVQVTPEPSGLVWIAGAFLLALPLLRRRRA
jgi:MYXO-CTERM domain-containing protein